VITTKQQRKEVIRVEVKHIHVQVPAEFKKEVEVFCIMEDLKLKDVVQMSLEAFMREKASKN
jgi:hypothetical protein